MPWQPGFRQQMKRASRCGLVYPHQVAPLPPGQSVVSDLGDVCPRKQDTHRQKERRQRKRASRKIDTEYIARIKGPFQCEKICWLQPSEKNRSIKTDHGFFVNKKCGAWGAQSVRFFLQRRFLMLYAVGLNYYGLSGPLNLIPALHHLSIDGLVATHFLTQRRNVAKF